MSLMKKDRRGTTDLKATVTLVISTLGSHGHGWESAGSVGASGISRRAAERAGP